MKNITIAGLLIVAGVFIGRGFGVMISEFTRKSVVDGPTIIGLGIGLLAAAVFTMMRKK